MVVVALEDELIPVGQIGAEFQEPMQPLLVIAEAGLRHPPIEELQPVLLAGLDQDVRCREGDVVAGQIRQERRQEPDIPEFTGLPTIARGVVAGSAGSRVSTSCRIMLFKVRSTGPLGVFNR